MQETCSLHQIIRSSDEWLSETKCLSTAGWRKQRTINNNRRNFFLCDAFHRQPQFTAKIRQQSFLLFVDINYHVFWATDGVDFHCDCRWKGNFQFIIVKVKIKGHFSVVLSQISAKEAFLIRSLIYLDRRDSNQTKSSWSACRFPSRLRVNQKSSGNVSSQILG